MTDYKNLLKLYPTVLSPTLYKRMFFRNRGPDPKICMVHYGQTVSAQWLLLIGYRHLQMPYLVPHCWPYSCLQTRDPSFTFAGRWILAYGRHSL